MWCDGPSVLQVIFFIYSSVCFNSRIKFKLLFVCFLSHNCTFALNKANKGLCECTAEAQWQSIYCSGLVSVDKASVKLYSQNKSKTSGQTFQIKTPLSRFGGHFEKRQKFELKFISWFWGWVRIPRRRKKGNISRIQIPENKVRIQNWSQNFESKVGTNNHITHSQWSLY